jgi:hypothetical protein
MPVSDTERYSFAQSSSALNRAARLSARYPAHEASCEATRNGEQFVTLRPFWRRSRIDIASEYEPCWRSDSSCSVLCHKRSHSMT